MGVLVLVECGERVMSSESGVGGVVGGELLLATVEARERFSGVLCASGVWWRCSGGGSRLSECGGGLGRWFAGLYRSGRNGGVSSSSSLSDGSRGWRICCGIGGCFCWLFGFAAVWVFGLAVIWLFWLFL